MFRDRGFGFGGPVGVACGLDGRDDGHAVLGECFGGLAVERGLGEGGELFEGRGVEVEEGGAWRRVCEESCEAGRRVGLEVARGLHGCEAGDGAPHGGGVQWVVLRGIVVVLS